MMASPRGATHRAVAELGASARHLHDGLARPVEEKAAQHLVAAVVAHVPLRFPHKDKRAPLPHACSCSKGLRRKSGESNFS